MNRAMRRSLQKRYKAICDLDEPTLRKLLPGQPSSDRVFWAGVHKARANLNIATDEQRDESLRWLASNGFKNFGGSQPKTGGFH